MDQNALLGSSPLVFLLFTIVMVGWAAFMTGNAVAATWRPMVQTVPYGILMGLADRFFVFALFGGELLSVTGFLIDTVILIGISLLAYRMTLARKMVGQYPWLYERTGLLGWREKGKG
jgi:branched-chain amino acid transport system ATP-binding protein